MGSGGHTPKWGLIRWRFRALLWGPCSSAHGLGPAGAYVGSARLALCCTLPRTALLPPAPDPELLED